MQPLSYFMKIFISTEAWYYIEILFTYEVLLNDSRFTFLEFFLLDDLLCNYAAILILR